MHSDEFAFPYLFATGHCAGHLRKPASPSAGIRRWPGQARPRTTE